METSHILLLILCSLITFLAGFFLGKWWSSLHFSKRHDQEKEKMFTIEQALKEFWDHERAKLEKEIGKHKSEIELLEGRIEHYRKKLSGVGLMGMGKDKKSDMLMSLLMENEALEEKLFQQNFKLHQEREEFLKKEVEHVSYKKVLLSHILNHPEVQQEIKHYINDNPEIDRIPLALPPTPPISSDPPIPPKEEREEGSS